MGHIIISLFQMLYSFKLQASIQKQMLFDSCSFVHRGKCESDRGFLRLLVQTGGAGLLSGQPSVSVQ